MKRYIIIGALLAGAILLAVTLSRLEGQSFTDVSGNVYRSEASRPCAAELLVRANDRGTVTAVNPCASRDGS